MALWIKSALIRKLKSRGYEIIKGDHANLQCKYDGLLAKYNHVLDAIRAYCDETDMESEGKLLAALRQFVWDESDDEALRKMERR